MSVTAEQRPAATEEAVQQPAAPRDADRFHPPTRPGMEDRGWLLVLGVFLALVVAFTAMIVITAVAGGDGFPR